MLPKAGTTSYTCTLPLRYHPLLCFDPRYLYNQVAVAKMLKDDKDHELESCSRLANLEVRRFHQQRLSEMKETLVQVRFSLAFNDRSIFEVKHSD